MTDPTARPRHALEHPVYMDNAAYFSVQEKLAFAVEQRQLISNRPQLGKLPVKVYTPRHATDES